MIAQIIIYLCFYIIGVVLGSFFTLAIYRIPLKQDITHTRSYCPKCNHNLGFWDLIPIISYLLLGGKCRYCHEKISKRYIIIEAISGLFYLLFILSLKINFLNITLYNIIEIIHGTLIIATLFILGGIEKETGKFSKGVLTFGLIAEMFYIIYLCVLKNNIYRYIIYVIVIATMSSIISLILKSLLKKGKSVFIYYFCFLNIITGILLNFIINI